MRRIQGPIDRMPRKRKKRTAHVSMNTKGSGSIENQDMAWVYLDVESNLIRGIQGFR